MTPAQVKAMEKALNARAKAQGCTTLGRCYAGMVVQRWDVMLDKPEPHSLPFKIVTINRARQAPYLILSIEGGGHPGVVTLSGFKSIDHVKVMP